MRELTKPDFDFPQLISRAQAAQLLGIDESTLCRNRDVPVVRLGRRVLYDVAELRIYVDSNREA